MKKNKKVILIVTLLLTLLLSGCSDSQTTESKIEENEKNEEVVIYTEKEEESLLLKSYNHGKNVFTSNSKDIFLPADTMSLLSTDLHDEYGDLDPSILIYEMRGRIMNPEKLSALVSEVNVKFDDVIENELNISVEEVLNLKNELLEKICLSYKYGMLNQAIYFTENLSSSNFENKVNNIIQSNSDLDPNVVNMVKSELYKSSEQTKNILIDVKNNYSANTVDEALVEEINTIVESYYDFMSDNLKNAPGDIYDLFYDVYVD